MRRHRPRALLSVGGYAAGPLALAALLSQTPLALLEPNARIGFTNRLLAPLVRRGYTAFAGPEHHFRARTVLRTGVPLRPGFVPLTYVRSPDRLKVLVLGGSQGARFLNERIPAALARARTPIEVVHQSGPAEEQAVRARYQELGWGERAQVVAFVDDMPAALGAAELVIGRAGASAVAELCAVGRPSLLVPYPFAAQNHQLWNARVLERAGAALVLTVEQASIERLGQEIDRLASSPGLLERMAERARALGRPDAAQAIARDLVRMGRLGAWTELASEDRLRSHSGLHVGTRVQAVAGNDRGGEALAAKNLGTLRSRAAGG